MANRPAVKLNASQPDFLQFNNLACETAGGKVIFATDEWFAPAQNLLKRGPPEFLASAFTAFGKWMDGWETRRKRIPGHDWCIVQLGVPGVIHGFDVDTSFFTGNYAPSISIQALYLPSLVLEGDRTGMAASGVQFEAIAQLHSENWEELIPESALKPGYSDSCHNYFSVSFPHRVSHIRLNMYPDGGIARLRVYGVGQRDWSTVPAQDEVDLVALVNGGVCVGYSNAHFGHPRNMIGKLICQLRMLYNAGTPKSVVLLSKIQDTGHFPSNFPDSCKIEACDLTPEEEKSFISSKWSFDQSPRWRMLLHPQKLKPHHRHFYSGDSALQCGPVTHVRLVIVPDGGVSRLRLWGRPVPVSSANPCQTSKL
uniref:Allantoate amidinohydrolase n=1 Tax=Electrophorus electricus TaxID=8005 RepID=A0A4W4F8C3_ELEEL